MAGPFCLPHTRKAQPVQPIARQVKQIAPTFTIDEKPRVVIVLLQKAVKKLRPDLIVGLTDGWPDHSVNIRGVGAKRLHRLDCRLKHTVHSAAPSGMGRAHNTRLGIAKQHRLTISGQYRQRHTGGCRNHRIGLGPLSHRPADLNNSRRMHLMHTDQIFRLKLHRFGHSGTVDLDHLGNIRRPLPTVQPREHT